MGIFTLFVVVPAFAITSSVGSVSTDTSGNAATISSGNFTVSASPVFILYN